LRLDFGLLIHSSTILWYILEIWCGTIQDGMVWYLSRWYNSLLSDIPLSIQIHIVIYVIITLYHYSLGLHYFPTDTGLHSSA